MRLSVTPPAAIGSILLLLALIAVASSVLGLSVGAAILGSLLVLILHWASEIIHQIGHGWAARRVGHPMIGIRLGTFWLLSTSIYPADEPSLPGAIHIRRALGGPLASLLLSVVAAIVAGALRPLGDMLWFVSIFFFLENLLIFTLGSLLPLGFNDGSTLLHWWGKP
jgi:hypothetical protein